jgi:hypothetical protein
LYNESFRFSEISEFKGKVIFEKKGRLKWFYGWIY